MDIRKLTDDELAIEAWKQIFKGVPQHLILNYDFFKPMAINNAKFIRQCIKDSTPKGLTQQEIIREMWEVDCQKILGTPENVHQVKLSAYAAAIRAAQERKGKDDHVA